MQVFVAFLLLAVLAGGARVGRPVREHPVLLLAASTIAAAGFYSLRVVL
ncbi:MAG: hypothetical protein KDB37_00150 [Ilumatobacter sp.]|nr:hypothetical protein [Ilumatobacter sp.]